MEIKNINKLIDKMDEKKSYVLEEDDRTFSNQETAKGFWIEGYVQCYKDMIRIISEYAV